MVYSGFHRHKLNLAVISLRDILPIKLASPNIRNKINNIYVTVNWSFHPLNLSFILNFKKGSLVPEKSSEYGCLKSEVRGVNNITANGTSRGEAVENIVVAIVTVD